jgi:hypothetical protein
MVSQTLPCTAKDVLVPGTRKEPGNEPAPGAEEDGKVQSFKAGDSEVVVHGAALAGETPVSPASKATEAVVAIAAEKVRFLVILPPHVMKAIGCVRTIPPLR